MCVWIYVETGYDRQVSHSDMVGDGMLSEYISVDDTGLFGFGNVCNACGEECVSVVGLSVFC